MWTTMKTRKMINDFSGGAWTYNEFHITYDLYIVKN